MAELRPYQRAIVDHALERPRAGLWAGMGLGKTVSTLAAFYLASLHDGARRVLVIAPRLVANATWPDEVRKWAPVLPLDCTALSGPPNVRLALVKQDTAVHTVSYELLPWLVEYWGRSWPYDTVVADEATRLKSFRLGGTAKGKRARALGKVAHTAVTRFWELSGTPAPQGVIDLWGQAWFLDRGERLGRTYTAFLDRWFRAGYNGFGHEALPGAFEQVTEKLSDICMSVEAKHHFDLPPQVDNVIRVKLPPKARRVYESMRKALFAELGDTPLEAMNAAAKASKLSQIANGAVYTDSEHNYEEIHDAKIEALDSILAEAAGEPALVAYYYRHDLERLKRAYPMARTLEPDGGAIRDWNAGRIPILLVHPASAGHGLNLQDGGRTLIFFGLTWNLEHYQQVIERIGPTRQVQSGHPRTVLVHHIVAEDTIDEQILATLQGKATIQAAIMAALRR